MQVAIITDTNSGIRQGEEEKGLFIVAMPFTISGKDYLDGENLSQKEFYALQEQGEDISTSQPSPAYLTELWDRVLKTYDAIVHIPMSSALSSSCATAKMLASDEPYEGRMFVVDNKRISVSLRAAVKEALTLRDQGQSPEEIKAYLEETEGNSTIYVTVDTLKYLKKGGRITPAAALIGTLLRIKPVLSLQNGKLDAWSKARTMKQAKQIMLSAIKADIRERFQDEDGSKCRFYLIHSANPDLAEEFAGEIQEEFPAYDKGFIVDDLSLSIVTHTGPGTLAIAAIKDSPYLHDEP